MSNPILAGINSTFQTQGTQQISVAESFDLNDDRFSNILENKLNNLQDDEKELTNNIIEKLGIPAGLEIEGFDYNSIAQELMDSTDKIAEINTESNIQDDRKFDVKSLIKDAQDIISPYINNSSTSPIKAVQNFWKSVASNSYSEINKHTIDDLSELLAAKMN